MSDQAKSETLCRLCGEMQLSSHQMFDDNSSEKDELVKAILGYLGIQFVDNGIMPNSLCDSCYYAAAMTNLFMKRVLSGQEKLKHLIEQKKTAKTAGKESLKNVVHWQEPSNDDINRGRAKKQAAYKCLDSFKRKPTNNTDIPVGNSTENDLLPSYDYISDNSDIPANKSNINEPFAELRAADGTRLATLVLIDTDIETNRLITIAKINFICGFCKKIFPSRDFAYHLIEQDNFTYQCTDCLQSCRNKPSFTKHKQQTNHQGVRIIRNSSETLNITEGIINSMEVSDEYISWSMHTSLKSSAEITEIDSSMTENLQDHGTMTKPPASNVDVRNSQSKTNGIVYHCKKCGMEFGEQKFMLRHFNYVHVGEPHFKCKECAATFKHQSNYSYHMAKHTGELRFKCDICTKAFRLKTELVTHIRTHTGDKPFKCEYCERGFATRSNMVTHTRIHTGLKPFKCEKCDRQFNRSSQLKAHKAVHLKQEKFSLSMLKFNSSEGQIEMLPPIRNSIGQVTAQNVTQNGISQLLESTAEGEFPFVSMLDSNNLQSLSEKNSDCSLPYLDPELNEILNIGIKDVERLEKSDAEFNDDSSFLNLNLLADSVIDSLEPSNNLASKGVYITYQDPENPNVSRFFVPK